MSRYNELRDIRGREFVPKYPDIPLNFEDQYFVTTEGDRFDPQLPQNSLYITPGTQIRVPSNPADIINNYRALNSL